MKTQRAVREVRRHIERDAPQCRVTALIEREDGHYAIALLDTKTGESFAINSLSEWDRRMDRLDYSEPEDADFDPEEETLRYQQPLQAEARREAQHEANVPRQFCCCVNCQEYRRDQQALEDLPF